ncbi:MAG: hypothetical protein ABSF36_01260 [Candidatus Methanomethylicaceae archaeon]|jgi:hypothetical protein
MSEKSELKIRLQLLEGDAVKETHDYNVDDRERALSIFTSVQKRINRKLGSHEDLESWGRWDNWRKFYGRNSDYGNMMVEALQKRKIDSPDKALYAQDIAKAVLEDGLTKDEFSEFFSRRIGPRHVIGRMSQGLSRVALKLEAQGELKSIGETGQKRYFLA